MPIEKQVVKLQFVEDNNFTLWLVDDIVEFDEIVDEFNEEYYAGKCGCFDNEWIKSHGYEKSVEQLPIDYIMNK